eukprot:TRINITY_DN29991_c0_g1_i1.p1 TRINITY_DN29991_c0_g1~~TRINITY_DN29991_c0_g1_i1.p1  ORF type:complete len:288 (+),score=67.67 TRINITY_DN29991_c0_g1_i1:45-866(+)
MSKLKVALCQLAVTANKAANVEKAVQKIGEAAKAGAGLVVLPECFNAPYGTQYFNEYAESVPNGETCQAMSQCAKDNSVFLVAGSIPERSSDDTLYNTSTVYAPTGELLGTYRKMHLFRINTEALKFDEGEVMSPGDDFTTVKLGQGITAGLGICFDCRYPQVALRYAAEGTNLLVYPGAFNMVTGPVHWKLTACARALDAQQYVVFCSPARDESASYVAYGHSLVVDPWGQVLAEGGEEESIVYADIDPAVVESTRNKLPILSGMRENIYTK